MTKNNLKIVFFGTPEFAVESLKRLVENNCNICAVVTAPDKQAGRGQHFAQSEVKKFAVEHGLRIMQPEKLKDEKFVDELRAINADLFIVIAFRMLPEVVWAMPRLGTFNLHASLLPKYRGAAPINWAVINGETETGVTTFFLKHEIDTGDIIQQKKISVGIKDNVGIIYDKLMHLGADMVIETVNEIANGNVHTTPQSELESGTMPTPAPKIFKDTCHIDWNQPAISVYNLIRGLSPYPAAWTQFKKNDKTYQIKIFETELPTAFTEDSSTQPGHAYAQNGKLFIACNDAKLEILSLQLAGKKRMSTAEFLRGFELNDIVFE